MSTALLIAVITIGAAALLTLVALLVGLRRVMLRRLAPKQPQPTNVGIDEIWQTWQAGGLAPAAALTGEPPPANLDAAALAAIRQDLLDVETRILEQPKPLEALRREIMDGVDRQVMNEEILALPAEVRQALRDQSDTGPRSDGETRRYLAANQLRTRLLRYYGAAKFADRADHDWYDLYAEAARLKRRSLRGFVDRRLMDSAAADDGRYRAAALVGERLKTRLLAVPPGTSFPKKRRAAPRPQMENSHER